MKEPKLIAKNEITALIEKENTLFITVPQSTLNIADKERFYIDLIEKSKERHISYTGSALPVNDIQNLYNSIKTNHFSTIVAIGGGTIMDIAKIISLALSNKLKNIEEIIDNPTGYKNTLQIVCIPTTCGTGSEATHFAVVYRDKKKYSIAEHSITPGFVVLDHQLLVTLPDKIRNSTVLDAISQAVESMWAKNATAKSKEFSENALLNLIAGLKSNIQVEKLKCYQKGSFLAGKAINISKTTASHAISYPLSSYFGIPHGVAVFLTLPHIAKLNHNNAPTDYFSKLFKLFGVSDIDELFLNLQKIMLEMGFSIKLKDYGITKKDTEMIAQRAIVPGRSDNNPADLTVRSIQAMLESTI